MARPASSGSALARAAPSLLSAALFGAGAPLSKLLLGDVPPALLAGLLYLGAGVGLTAHRALRRGASAVEAPLARGDLLPLAGVILFGGVVGPLLLLLGLDRLSGVAGSLLLNLEAPLTILLAVALFGEHLGGREVAAVALLLAGGVALAARPGQLAVTLPGALAVAGACLAWAIDNNLTGRLALRDPVAVTRTKTLAAGTCNVALGLALGARWPGARGLAGALVVGTFAYGVSIVLALRGMRLVGTARHAACFATAPFVGALVSMPLLGERPSVVDAAAGAAMVLGVVLLLRARHGHVHTHEPIEHEHRHVHDEHHQHAHDGPVVEPHAHRHRHDPLTHDHPHVSDAHHRHRHRHRHRH